MRGLGLDIGYLPEDINKWRAVVNTVMNILPP